MASTQRFLTVYPVVPIQIRCRYSVLVVNGADSISEVNLLISLSHDMTSAAENETVSIIKSVPRSKNDLTTTLLITKFF